MTEFETVVRGIVTLHGLVLVAGERFPGVGIEDDIEEDTEEGLEDMLGVEVEMHQFVDAVIEDGLLELYVHAEADDKDLDPVDDLEAEWVDPSNLEDELGDEELERLERKRMQNFVEKLIAVPSRKS